jgi:tetratricopeptide (TPR) repeat protein
MRFARFVLFGLLVLLIAERPANAGDVAISMQRPAPKQGRNTQLDAHALAYARASALNGRTSALKDDWVQVKSKNFFLIGNASEKEVRKVATRLEQFRETFRLLFSNANLTAAVPVNVVVFKDDTSYRPFKPRKADGTIDTEVSGYFQSGDDFNYITISIDGGDREAYGTIFHEYAHFIIGTTFGRTDVPQWLNEGLAEYYQTFEIEGDLRVKLGLPQSGHLSFLQQNSLWPLDKLLNFTNYDLHQSRGNARNVFYAQSWALVHYLTQTGRSGNLDKYIKATTAGTLAKKAFEDAFQTTFAKMETELRRYVASSSYNYQLITLKRKLNYEAEMQVSPIDEATSNAYLGELLYLGQRQAEAEPYLQAALKLQPDSSVANTALGMIRLSQRRFDEARGYLEKAIATDPKSHLPFYRYAHLLGREGRDEYGFVNRIEPATAAKMRAALKKAIALSPAFTESYELLAFISLVNNEDLDTAIGYLHTALEYQPGNQKYSLRIAEILTRQNKFDEATRITEKIARVSDHPETKSRAASLLTQIAELKEFAQRHEAEKKRLDAQIANAGGVPIQVKRVETDRPPTEEETAKQNEHLKMRALNEILRKPAAGEHRVRGSVQRIDCRRRPLLYSIKTATETFTVTTKDFDALYLRAYDPAAMKVSVGCDANLASFTALITFKSMPGIKGAPRGELIALEFVPSDFRFMTEEEMRTATLVIYDMPGNAKPDKPSEVISIGTITEDSEARRKVIVAKEINNALRKPLDGEKRETGFLERIECTDKNTYFHIRTGIQLLKLGNSSTQSLRVYIYTPDLVNTLMDCNTKAIEFPAVFTYSNKPDTKNKTAGEILSLEFVPKSFVLDQ